MLELKVESDNICQIKGQFTRQYINDIILPGEAYIAKTEHPSFNLKEVDVCDSAGVALIIHWWRVAIQNKKSINFNELSDKMLAIMQVSGIEVEANKLKI